MGNHALWQVEENRSLEIASCRLLETISKFGNPKSAIPRVGL
jgi:hypothetical protein